MNNYLIKLRYKLILLCLLIFMFGCQSNLKLKQNEQVSINHFFLDNKFPTYQSYYIETEEEIFALDDKMRLMVKNKLKPIHSVRQRSIMLAKHIFGKDNIDLAYRSEANVPARMAYQNHEANCLSLTIMAYSLAKEAGLNVSFQDVKIPEYWVRNGENNMLSGHVNLLVRKIKTQNQMFFSNSNILTIDFDSAIVQKSFPTKIIRKNTILAMFYSNKGGQALFDKQYDKAYAYFKAAIEIDPSFSAAWGNLGVLYRKINNDEYALKSYRHSIEINSENYNALSNMSIILNAQGKHDEVRNIKKLLFTKRNKNAYYHALLADEAFQNADYPQALKHYRHATMLNRNVHEFHFGLAKVYFTMNDYQRAEKSLQRAIAYSRNKSINNRYLAKMDTLKQTENY